MTPVEVHPETLAVLDPGPGARSRLDDLRDVATVTQVLPPRLALVALPAGGPRPRVRGVEWYDERPPAAVLDGLTPQERTFVAAWAARLAGKRRALDGAPWDTPGLQPPDRPHRPPQ